MVSAQRCCAGFRKFSKKKFMHRARATPPLGFDSLPSLSDVGARFILRNKAEVSKRQYSSKAKGSNVRDFLAAKNTVSGYINLNRLNFALEFRLRTLV
jgi:hypothetical protein